MKMACLHEEEFQVLLDMILQREWKVATCYVTSPSMAKVGVLRLLGPGCAGPGWGWGKRRQ